VPFQAEHLVLPINIAALLTSEMHELVCRNKYTNEEPKIKPAFLTKSITVSRTFLIERKAHVSFRLTNVSIL
jgi:hypothetical protein